MSFCDTAKNLFNAFNLINVQVIQFILQNQEAPLTQG